MNSSIFEHKILVDKIVFADGISRTGKAMLSNLLLGFENMSSIQFINPLEQLTPMYVNNKIDKNALSSYLRVYLNENIYNYQLSRNLNFRSSDLTSIYNTNNPKQFIDNLSKTDGDSIIDYLKTNNTYYQFQSHELLSNYSKFLELNLEINIIELFRHPIDTIHSWYKRGWGRRFDNADPRNFSTLFQYGDYIVPHFIVGHEEEYIKLNEMEKCVFTHNLLVKKSIKEYKTLNKHNKSKMLILRYEDILINPNKETDKISNFLNIDKSYYMVQAMKDARVPREIYVEQRKSKLDEIISKISVDLHDDLKNLYEYYENEFYELCT